MKTIIGEVKGIFSEYGYKKERNSFWKIENDFYRLINFQHGAYGDYFFVNVGLHPVGLPSLYTGKLEIKEKPKEHECIIRQRMEQIVPIPSLEKALTFPTHENIVQDIIFNFPKVNMAERVGLMGKHCEYPF